MHCDMILKYPCRANNRMSLFYFGQIEIFPKKCLRLRQNI